MENLTSKQDSTELYYAEMEAARNKACEAYFAARPHRDVQQHRDLFDVGFERAFKLLWRPPVEPPLTRVYSETGLREFIAKHFPKMELRERTSEPPSVSYTRAAWVPVHPREGFLWANAIKTPDADHPANYPLVPVFVQTAVTKSEPCKGKNCGSTDPRLHSAECFEEYDRTTAGSAHEAETEEHVCDGGWACHFHDVKEAERAAAETSGDRDE